MNKRIKAVMTGFIVALSLIMVSAPTLAQDKRDYDIKKIGYFSDGNIYVDEKTGVEYLVFDGGSYYGLRSVAVTPRYNKDGSLFVHMN